jgi:hypothetical protein
MGVRAPATITVFALTGSCYGGREFWSMLAGKTTEAYKSACKLVLGIDENWADADVRGIDVQQQMDRYVRLHGASAKPASLATYGQRVRAAIELYRTFLGNPTGFRGPTPKRQARPQAARVAERTEKAAPQEADEQPSPRPQSREAVPSLVTYPFPLRSGVMAYLQLPRDLSRSDVKRLCGLLENLAIDAVEDSST